jgi:hypothetical protein
MQNTVAKKRARQEDEDSGYHFGNVCNSVRRGRDPEADGS